VRVSKLLSLFYCAICGKFVKMDSSQTDSHGRTVHRECLAAERGAQKPPLSGSRDERSPKKPVGRSTGV
jgi:hypothetical protein